MLPIPAPGFTLSGSPDSCCFYGIFSVCIPFPLNEYQSRDRRGVARSIGNRSAGREILRRSILYLRKDGGPLAFETSLRISMFSDPINCLFKRLGSVWSFVPARCLFAGAASAAEYTLIAGVGRLASDGNFES